MSNEWVSPARHVNREIIRSLRRTIFCTAVVVVLADAAAVIAATTGGIVAALALQVPTIIATSLLTHDIVRRAILLRAYRSSAPTVPERKAVLQRSMSTRRKAVVDSMWTRLAWPRTAAPEPGPSLREFILVVILLTTTGFAAQQLTGESPIALAASVGLLAIYMAAKIFAYLTDMAYVSLLFVAAHPLLDKGDGGSDAVEGV